jgi:hypothetical protein
MRKVFCAAVLMMALGCPALAGEIHNPAPQPAKITIQETTAGGEIHNPLTVAEIMLSLLSGVLPLL